jgi:hypothetical protein
VSDGGGVLLVGADQSLSYATQDAAVHWTRHEALAHVRAVEMFDLPLTESQADIEMEFSDEQGLCLCELLFVFASVLLSACSC